VLRQGDLAVLSGSEEKSGVRWGSGCDHHVCLSAGLSGHSTASRRSRRRRCLEQVRPTPGSV